METGETSELREVAFTGYFLCCLNPLVNKNLLSPRKKGNNKQKRRARTVHNVTESSTKCGWVVAIDILKSFLQAVRFLWWPTRMWLVNSVVTRDQARRM